MKISIIIATALSLALSGPILAQAPKAEEKQFVPSAAKPKTFTITGKITKGVQGYIIKRQKPPERFAIMNPNPEVLDSLVKSGKTVTIQVVSVMGDNVKIKKIDGKPYEGEEAKIK
jgi:hypothetical protein